LAAGTGVGGVAVEVTVQFGAAYSTSVLARSVATAAGTEAAARCSTNARSKPSSGWPTARSAVARCAPRSAASLNSWCARSTPSPARVLLSFAWFVCGDVGDAVTPSR